MGAELTNQSPKPICAVVDTSVWRKEPLLKTPLGLAFVYELSRRGGVLGLPEVVELELKATLVEAGRDAAAAASGHLHTLHTITDDPFLVTPLPNEDKLRQKVEERLTQLDPLLVREPFTVEQAKAALAMVNAKVPPNGEKNQQFKDSAIWQAVLVLSLRYSTALITTDNAFFRNRDPEKGLAENLVEDCSKAGRDIKGFCGIGAYLSALRGEKPEFDRDKVRELITPVAMKRLKAEAERCRTIPGELLDCTISGFPTNDPDRIAIDYEMIFRIDCSPEDGAVLGIPDRGTVYGSAYFLPKDSSLTDHYVQEIHLRGRGNHSGRSFRDYDAAFPIPRPLSSLWD